MSIWRRLRLGVLRGGLPAPAIRPTTRLCPPCGHGIGIEPRVHDGELANFIGQYPTSIDGRAGEAPRRRTRLLPIKAAQDEIIAGMMLAAIAMPEAIGDARDTGSYTMLTRTTLLAMFGSARHPVVARVRQ